VEGVPAAVAELATELEALGWVTDLFVAGSLATGDYVPGVSDLDLVALVDGPVDARRVGRLTVLHRGLDHGVAAGQALGCAYVDGSRVGDLAGHHPTWTHGSLQDKWLSGITRAELVLHGFAVFGRQPRDVLPPMGPDDVREAARAELLGYWATAARRPWWWLDRVMPDLGLTAMARGRHALATGELLTKTRAVEEAHAPGWLVDQMRARRRGEHVTSPRVRSAVIAWTDARRTVAQARARTTRR
jgi:hypothetical protein